MAEAPPRDARDAESDEPLYAGLAQALTQLFGCTLNTLPRELELTFGRSMTTHGRKLDNLLFCREDIAANELSSLRIVLSQGLAYQVPNRSNADS